MFNGEDERSVDTTVDFDKMVLSSYVGDWPMVSVVTTCDRKETAENSGNARSFHRTKLTSTPSLARAVLD